VKVAVRIRSYEKLQSALSARRRSLGLRQLELDERSGLQSGYSGKIEIGVRRLGPISLPNLLAALDCDLLLCPRGSTAPVEPRGGSCGVVQHLRPTNGEPS
jgi:transcriptional regulator with XRE-family HTH domain